MGGAEEGEKWSDEDGEEGGLKEDTLTKVAHNIARVGVFPCLHQPNLADQKGDYPSLCPMAPWEGLRASCHTENESVTLHNTHSAHTHTL